ncbi:FAD-binding oxidoreductase [candidate division NPL-UPA2 bacterium]|nr:FAD-binding oxidoreductase [candidate division NPL-UPA2 bacterium]
MNKTIDDQIVNQLETIAGKENVLVNELDMEPYSHDETPGLRSFPEAVVKPTETEQISQILRLANEKTVPATPRGGGTGLSGGAVPLCGGLVVSLERMNKILDIDTNNSMATVQAGVINGELQREAEKLGLFYPVNPASMDSCTIGGNVAENCGGANAVRYGTTKDYVCGLEVILADGQIVRAGGKLVKNATDFSLIQLLLGSEGTLGIMNEITLRLVPLPEATVVLIIPFDDLSALSEIVREVFQTRIVLTMIEIMDRRTIKACQEFLDRKIPFDEARAHLLLRLDGKDRKELEGSFQAIGEICLNKGGLDVLVVEEISDQRKIWEVRQSIHEALVDKAHLLTDEDVVVPRTEITNLLSGVQEISKRHNLPVANFGHLGDGNIHVNFLREDLEEEVARKALTPALNELFRLAVSLGGKISGEHGVGLFKKPYFPLSVDKNYIKLMRGIKKVFDPSNILNPGKIFD